MTQWLTWWYSQKSAIDASQFIQLSDPVSCALNGPKPFTPNSKPLLALQPTVNPIKLETGLRPNSAGNPYALLLRIEAIGFPTFRLLL